jgi:hypothetical protein
MFWLTPCGSKNLLVLHTLPLLDAFNHVVDYKSFDSLLSTFVLWEPCLFLDQQDV